MRYRKLRIAWSVVWGVVALPLVVLWVRSYWYDEWIYASHRMSVGAESVRGKLMPFWIHDHEQEWARIRVFSGPYMGPVPHNVDFTEYPTNFSLPVRSFSWYASPYYFSVVVP